MTTVDLSSHTLGWVAIATGVASLLAALFLALFFTLGQPFGSLNDGFIGIASILSGVMAWMVFSASRSQAPQLRLLALLVALVGAIVVAVGSGLVISAATGWYLAGLYMMAGNALIGLWLIWLISTVQRGGTWPHGLAVFGIFTGAIMAIGLLAVPGIIRGLDAWEAAPWVVNVGLLGGLGWIVAFPIWCVWLGKITLGR